MHRPFIALILVTCLMAAGVASGQDAAPPPKPISLQGLADALRIGGLSTSELVDIVKQRGVAFRLTEEAESALRQAGAAAPLLDAVRANYRGPDDVPKALPLGPLAKKEILTLLQVGTPTARIAQIVTQRGVDFAMTPPIAEEFKSAGADTSLLVAVELVAPKPVTAATSPPAQPVAQTTTATEPAAAAPKPVPLRSIKEVRKLYVDKMKSNLDQYLRAELSKQLPGRFTLVLVQEEADALLVGRGEQQEGAAPAITGRALGLHDTATGAVSMVDKAGTVLWASEAGDRTLLFGALKRGGAREVASRLVQDLKKRLAEED